ncbi:BTB domain-containing protein [Mycena venus]|uniref:BTB domain-containing protein n=1 Tax=Mycena venus TaxID=2733690 RepID=A0A8H6YL19_9AGAR|nr:BTB domain-containing protein [Mycena venus]
MQHQNLLYKKRVICPSSILVRASLVPSHLFPLTIMSNDSASVLIQDAPAPFSGVFDPEHDAHPRADFILRSSDGVDFHVHRAILCFASECFDGMFSMPLPPDELQRDSLPILTLPEPSAVLLRLLRLAYPASTLSHYGAPDGDFAAVYAAAQKYGFCSVQRLLEEILAAQPKYRFGFAWGAVTSLGGTLADLTERIFDGIDELIPPTPCAQESLR